MTIFARRSVQSFLTALDGTLTPSQLTDLVHRLNLENLDSLATEWEVCILYSLMKLGKITYERAMPGKSRPDIYFESNDHQELECVVDVRLISDSDLEENNPIFELTQLLYAKARKFGILGTFSYTVGSSISGQQGSHKVKLSIPHKKKLAAFLDQRIVPQLRVIARNSDRPARIDIIEHPWELTLFYNPAQQFSYGSYRAFRNATSLTKNPLYNALQKKRKQLRDSEYQGCKGIIICDGGCEVIQKGLKSWETYSRKQILQKFFKNTNSVSFVIFIWVEVQDRPSVERQLRVCGEIEVNPNATIPLPPGLLDLLRRLPEFWPNPVLSGETARLQVEGYGPRKLPRSWGRPVGGYKMGSGPNRISYRMSARELMEILSGRKTIQEFERDAGFALPGAGGPINPFENALRRGFTINDVALQPLSDRDDDWIEFRIMGPDPALGPFRNPAQSSE
jgi:hypothetical protein